MVFYHVNMEAVFIDSFMFGCSWEIADAIMLFACSRGWPVEARKKHKHKHAFVLQRNICKVAAFSFEMHLEH